VKLKKKKKKKNTTGARRPATTPEVPAGLRASRETPVRRATRP
jgi:hypothetical protein